MVEIFAMKFETLKGQRSWGFLCRDETSQLLSNDLEQIDLFLSNPIEFLCVALETGDIDWIRPQLVNGIIINNDIFEWNEIKEYISGPVEIIESQPVISQDKPVAKTWMTFLSKCLKMFDKKS